MGSFSFLGANEGAVQIQVFSNDSCRLYQELAGIHNRVVLLT